MKPSPSESGLALIEVLVALVIFAALLVVMNRSVAIGLAGLRAAERTAEAVDVAQSILAEAGATFPLADGAVQTGGAGGFAWSATMAAYRPPAGDASPAGQPEAPKAFWVDVRVNWNERRTGSRKSLSLRSIKVAGAP